MNFGNIKNAKKLFYAALVGAVAFTSCNKFLDINDSPNNPISADPSLLLPTVEASLGQLVGNSLQVYGGFWAQYWTQNPTSSQYRVIDQYRILNTATDRAWLTIYQKSLINAEQIITSKVAGNEHYKGLALILKAYTFQVATDAFGDIPLSEALNPSLYPEPNYEKQSVVYDSIFSYIDQGLLALEATNVTAVGSQDMLFSGDITKWKAFANTLKLRAYLRLSEVDAAKAEAGVKSLYANNPTFLTDDVTITYTTTGGNQNPLHNEMIGLGRTQNIVASATAVKAFLDNNDPRRFSLYSPLAGQDTIAYLAQGSYAANSTKLVSPPSGLVGAKANEESSAVAPAKLMSETESYFLQAEAAVRGWGNGVAADLFEQGVTASFKATGNAADVTKYLADAVDAQFPTDKDGQLKAVITQKYYAMCGFQGFEAWTEWRRTGYPTFLIRSAAAGSYLPAGKMPLRLPYANSELTSNGSLTGSITIDTPVWWDVD